MHGSVKNFASFVYVCAETFVSKFQFVKRKLACHLHQFVCSAFNTAVSYFQCKGEFKKKNVKLYVSLNTIGIAIMDVQPLFLSGNSFLETSGLSLTRQEKHHPFLCHFSLEGLVSKLFLVSINVLPLHLESRSQTVLTLPRITLRVA